jgi:hypothetical protein
MKNWTHKVRKQQRGINGAWFSYPTCYIGTGAECHEYAAQFAAEQSGVVGTRIAVLTRGERVEKYYAVK